MIVYTKHAVERAKERGIEIKDIEACIKNPDSVTRDSMGNLRFMKRKDSKVLVVVSRKEDSKTVVITCFLSSKVSKYLET